MRRFWVCGVAAGAIGAGAMGQTGQSRPRLLVDAGTTPLSSEPAAMVRLGNKIVFSALTSESGRELWMSDGTGATMVRDLLPGMGSGIATSGLLLTRLTTGAGDVALFAATDGLGGTELWATDGTDVGTRMVKDIRPGSLGSSPQAGFVRGGWLYFSADDGVSGRELWRTNGTEIGTQRVINLGDDTTGQGPIGVNPVVLGFTGSGGVFLSTTLGTVFVDAGFTGATVVSTAGVYRDGYAVMGEHLYYSNFSAARNDHELWRSDGTVAGTGLFKDVNPGLSINSWPEGFFVARGVGAGGGDVLYFNAVHPDFGYELFKSDGTEAGTVLVKDIRTGNPGSSPRVFAQVGDKVLAWASVSGVQLVVSDGTEAGTGVLSDMIYSGLTSAPYTSAPTVVREAGATYFIAKPNGSGTIGDVYRVDDAAPGQPVGAPVRVSGLASGSVGAYAVAPWLGTGGLIMGGGSSAGTELLLNTGGATSLLADLRPGTGGSEPGWLTPVGGRIVFAARSPTLFALWGADVDHPESAAVLPITVNVQEPSTNSGLVPAVAEGNGGAGSGPRVVLRGGDANSGGEEPWHTDGTLAGTGPIGDFTPGSGGSSPTMFKAVEGRVVFVASLNSVPWFFATDGTLAATVPLVGVRGIIGGITSSAIQPVPGGFVWYGTPVGQSLGLHRTPVQSGETVKLTTAPPSVVWPGTASGGVVYFRGVASGSGDELWKTDGTDIGTGIVANIAPAGAGSTPQNIVGTGDGAAFFTAATTEFGRELYFTDGTEMGTVMLGDLTMGQPGTTVNYSAAMVNEAGTRVGFFVINGQLWVSNGTPQGTFVLQDMRPSTLEQYRLLATIAGTMYFSANDGITGQELWESDGTAAGTRRLTDLCPGDCPSITTLAAAPPVVRVRSRLVFAGDDGKSGTELWVLDLCPADFDNDGQVGVQDIFDYLAAWFGGDARADVDGVAGVGVQDLFDWLAGWFAGC